MESWNRMRNRRRWQNFWKIFQRNTSGRASWRFRESRFGHGGLTKELWVDRRENSKSITWSSVRMAFQNVLKMKESLSEGEKPYVKRPKALGDIRGVSYIYPLFDRFGLIETDPDKGENNGVQMCLQLEEASAHSEAEENTEGEIAR